MLSRINIKLSMLLVPHQIYTVGASGTRLLMWATTGNYGYQWTYANVILSNPTPFRVSFQAEVGGDMWTNIALDDISYAPECMVGGKAEFLSFVLILSLGSWFLSVPFSPAAVFHATYSNLHLLTFPLFPHFLSTNIHAPLLSFHMNCTEPHGKVW